MKLISLNITEAQEELIKLFINLKYFPNRSEAIRHLLNDGIKLQLEVTIQKSKLRKTRD